MLDLGLNVPRSQLRPANLVEELQLEQDDRRDEQIRAANDAGWACAWVPARLSRGCRFFANSLAYTPVDFIRCGQDGLAALTSGGHIYLLRGAAVVPQLLNQNLAATLTASSTTTIAHGSGNTLLTLTGGNFVPGVAVTWNGGYRTTTIVDATHVTVAIPASDLAAAGTGSLVATNPGASGSSALTVTVN